MRPASALSGTDVMTAAEIRTELEKVLASAELVRFLHQHAAVTRHDQAA